jgi:hypothetical protein
MPISSLHLELARLEIENFNAAYESAYKTYEREMLRVLVEIVLSVLLGLELDHEAVGMRSLLLIRTE